MVTSMNGTIHNLKVGDDTTEGIKDRVEDQGLQRCFLVTLRMRNTLHDGIQDILNTLARLS